MTKNNILSRQLINPNFLLIHEDINTKERIEFNRDKFCEMVDFWKVLLVEKYHAKPGMTVMLEFNFINIYYYTAVFAIWELGLIMIVDWPHAFSYEDATSHRMTMHGKVDFALVYSEQTNPNSSLFSYWDHQRNLLNCNVIVTEQNFNDYKIQDHTKYQEIKNYYPNENDDAVWTGSSGTTGLAKQIKITHKEIFLQFTRLIKLLNFNEGDSTIHTNNLHHGASMCYHFLPSFACAHEHYIYNSDSNINNHYYEELSQKIINNKINKVLLYSSDKLLNFLKTTPVLNHELDIITLFYISKECIELIHKKNINSVRNVFGDTAIGYGFLVKIVDQKVDAETYDFKWIGPKLDDFFDFKIEDGYLHVKAVGLGEDQWKTSHDQFKLINDQYYFYGRGQNYRIADNWINLGELDYKLQECFPNNTASAVIDVEEQQLYLSIWKENPEGEEMFNKFLSTRYDKVKVNKIARNLNPAEFFASRKIDLQKLKSYFRNTKNAL